jgi:exodeoxyribonuclease VII large subunit
MSGAAGRLNALSPLATLSRGYAVARGEDGEALTSATQFAPGDSFDLTLHDGVVDATVDRVKPKGPSE